MCRSGLREPTQRLAVEQALKRQSPLRIRDIDRRQDIVVGIGRALCHFKALRRLLQVAHLLIRRADAHDERGLALGMSQELKATHRDGALVCALLQAALRSCEVSTGVGFFTERQVLTRVAGLTGVGNLGCAAKAGTPSSEHPGQHHPFISAFQRRGMSLLDDILL
jgi:hypothetical protein